jgi:hypothetical protein
MKRILLFLLAICSTVVSISPSKIVVIADVHSDIHRFKQILQDAHIIDKKDHWIAPPNTFVVQLGDQIDPKLPDKDDISDNHHYKMIYFTDNLQKSAQANSSNFISMIGNHELMNLEKIKTKSKLRDIIALRPIVHFDIDKYLFCHGGFKKRHYYILHIYNKTLRDLNTIWYKYVYDMSLTLTEEVILNNLILDTENSILYTRTQDTNRDINMLFNLIDVDYMFVGHTVYDSIRLKDKIWYLDLYLKDAFDNSRYNYIVIENGNIIVKTLEDTTFSLLI